MPDVQKPRPFACIYALAFEIICGMYVAIVSVLAFLCMCLQARLEKHRPGKVRWNLMMMGVLLILIILVTAMASAH